ncbi:cupin domain-containing protein [Nitrosococcus wardiae]|uniref:Cupin domain-containing protein n=1 Tax=Nitrosococcus wardiae TaxID=1814290 RepID=A0A4P7C393_9GAMM|nr:cupin domain-containing protein [Nitrosococcus wardiae]QBQ55262.1 cupin domain-containing protein [Nitrosococcus wardiae]
MRPEVKKSNLSTEFKTEERCYIAETANDSGDEYVSISRARVEPGVTTAWHKLKGITERYIIISGQGRVEISDLAPTDAIEGDVVRIPADTTQRITNTGQIDLIFYAVCSPPFQTSCYVSLEEDFRNPNGNSLY